MSLAVSQLSLGPVGTNCYVVRADAGAAEAVVIDPSGGVDEISAALGGARCVAILATHGHWDHLLGVADLAEATGAPVTMAEGAKPLLVRLSEYMVMAPPGLAGRPWTPDVLLQGGETLSLAGIDFEVLWVPGHEPWHLAYATDGYLFSGDVLFAGSVGRTDFAGGDWETLRASIRMLVERFPPETVVCSGHGPVTTLGAELATNPFLSGLRA